MMAMVLILAMYESTTFGLSKLVVSPKDSVCGFCRIEWVKRDMDMYESI